MKATFKYLILAILLLGNFYRAIGGNTITVVNPGNNNDIMPKIENAINLAADGDIIVLPEGIFTFTDQLEIRKKVSLMGAGLSKTILYRSNTLSDNVLNYKPMIKYVVYSDNPCGIVVSGICFRSKTDKSSLTLDHGLEMQQAVDFVIHDCRFEYFGEAGIYILHKDNLARGLIYNCQFYHNYKGDGLGYGYGITVQGSNSSWVSSPNFGSSNFIFIEDNTFEFHRHSIVSGEGGLYVARYNTILNNLIGNAVDMHEARNETSFASRASEIYNNNIKNTLFTDETPLIPGQGTTYLANTAICIRGGEAVIYNNATEGFRYGLQVAAAWYLEGAYPIKCQTGYKSGLAYGINDNDPSHSEGDMFVWNNNHVVYQTANPYPYFLNSHTNYLKEGRDYNFTSKPGYTAYTYPHPMRGSSAVSVSSIVVSGNNNVATISINGGSLQMVTSVLPQNATNKSISWSISSGADLASISSDGVLKAMKNGNVTVKATAKDGSEISGTKTISISGQLIKVSSITLSGANNLSAITSDKGTLQMQAIVTPSDAENKNVTWSVSSGTDFATISSTGLLTAVKNGSVTVKALANDGSGVYGTKVITISGQLLKVTAITLSGANNTSNITSENGSLQMQATISPADATDKSITWSLTSGSEYASISSSGLITAVKTGSVTVKATAADGSGVYGTKIITISNQIVKTTSITVKGANNAIAITTRRGSLQLLADVLPSDATSKDVTWSITSGTDLASISSTGVLSGYKNGLVTVKATANDDSGVSGTLVITISGQIVKIRSISIHGHDDKNYISELGGTLQLEALIEPTTATNTDVTWKIKSGDTNGFINKSGLVSALKDGIIEVMAIANDSSGIQGEMVLTITGQNTSNPSLTQNNFEIYPNPAQYSVNIIITDFKNTGLVKICTLTGAVIKEISFTTSSINIDSLKPGYYILIFDIDNRTYKKKLQVY